MLKKTGLVISVILFISVTTMQFCRRRDETPAPVLNAGATAEKGEELSGGTATVFDGSNNSFGFVVPNVSQAEKNKFALGNSVFKSNWVTAPATTTGLDGLGPFFNSRSCSGCHKLDGRGLPPANPGDDLNGLLFRLSIPGTDAHGGPLGDPQYGEQLSNHGVYAGENATVIPEGNVIVTYTTMAGTYKDGSTYELRNPIYTFTDPGYGAFAAGIMYSPRLAQQIPGLGLLEAVDIADILAFADPSDINEDGISGRPNYVWNYTTNTTELGRFGWKANQPTLFQQTTAASLGDMGITNRLFQNENLTGRQIADYGSWTNGGTPEMSNNDLDQLVFYCQTLAVPARRNWQDQQVLRGKELFIQAKCANCHNPYFVTGTHEIAGLSNQKIRPYTDLLLHDMGDGLADNRPDYLATGNEWRTPPLWGLGLIKTVSGGRFLLHDGRARTLEEAIIWHGGEGTFSQQAFINMNSTDRAALLKFLESL